MAQARAGRDRVPIDLATRVAFAGIHAPSTIIAVLARDIDAIRAAALAQGASRRRRGAGDRVRTRPRGIDYRWIAVLHDAVLRDRPDADAHAAYAAACCVRLID